VMRGSPCVTAAGFFPVAILRPIVLRNAVE
jgi:hypothetical protein